MRCIGLCGEVANSLSGAAFESLRPCCTHFTCEPRLGPTSFFGAALAAASASARTTNLVARCGLAASTERERGSVVPGRSVLTAQRKLIAAIKD